MPRPLLACLPTCLYLTVATYGIALADPEEIVVHQGKTASFSAETRVIRIEDTACCDTAAGFDPVQVVRGLITGEGDGGWSAASGFAFDDGTACGPAAPGPKKRTRVKTVD